MEMTKERAKDLIKKFREKYVLVRIGNGRKIHVIQAGTDQAICGSGRDASGKLITMRVVRIDEVCPDAEFCAHCNSQIQIGRALYVLSQPDAVDATNAEPAKIETAPVSEPAQDPANKITTLDQAFRIVRAHLAQTPADADMRSSAKLCLTDAYAARGRQDYIACIAWLHRADSYLVGANNAKRIGLMDPEQIAQEEISGIATLRTQLEEAKKNADDYKLMYLAANDLWEETKKDLAAMTELRDDAELRASDNQQLFDDARHGWEELKHISDVQERALDEARAQIVTMNAAMEEMRQTLESTKKDLENARARNDQLETELDDAISDIQELEDSI